MRWTTLMTSVQTLLISWNSRSKILYNISLLLIVVQAKLSLSAFWSIIPESFLWIKSYLWLLLLIDLIFKLLLLCILSVFIAELTTLCWYSLATSSHNLFVIAVFLLLWLVSILEARFVVTWSWTTIEASCSGATICNTDSWTVFTLGLNFLNALESLL